MRYTLREVILVTFCLLLVFHVTSCEPQFPELWDWRERHRRRQDRNSRRLVHTAGRKIDVRLPLLDSNDLAEATVNVTSVSREDSSDDDVPILNVTDEDSPYALIDKFFPDREINHRRMETDFENAASKDESLLRDVQPLQPREVWLADGDLLVLKGGQSDDGVGFDSPWKPLDDFEAPYREPKLPPPDFIPDDTGVGVPLPPEDDDIVSNTIDFDEKPIKLDSLEDLEEVARDFVVSTGGKPFDEEEKIIRQMENFHFIRYSDVISQPSSFPFSHEPIKVNPTEKPRLPVRPTSSSQSFSYSYQTSGPLIALEKSRTAIPRQLTTASTTNVKPSSTPKPRSTTTPSPPQTTTTSPTSTPLSSPSTTQLNPSNIRGLSPRAPKSFATQNVAVPSFEQNPATVAPIHYEYIPDVNYGNRLHNQLSVETNEIGDTDHFHSKAYSILPFSRQAPVEQTRVRRRPVFIRPASPPQAPRGPKQIVPTIHQLTPRPSDNTVRRNGGRYVSYFQGNVGGKFWSYSYRL